MNRCLLVIPLKPFALAKSRLAGALNPNEREQLARALFLRSEQFFASAFAAMPRLVVTAEPEIAELCSPGTQILREAQPQGLNQAAERARDFAQIQGFSQMLIASADIALWRRSEVAALLQAGKTHDLAIARAHDGGSNALLLRLPADGFVFAYGEHSARAHQQSAQQARLSCSVLDLPLLSRDLDLPSDLLLWQAKQKRSQVLS